MINKDGGVAIFRFCGGRHNCYEGGHIAHGGCPSPPLGKTLISPHTFLAVIKGFSNGKSFSLSINKINQNNM